MREFRKQQRQWGPGLASLVLLLAAEGAFAAPPPPPGGHHPIYFGGANTAPYPALSPTDVGEPVAGFAAAPFAVSSAPNPFSKETLLRLRLPKEGRVEIELFNLEGRRVRRFDLGRRPAGPQEIMWDGRDDLGRVLASGVYLFRAKAGGESALGRLVFLR